jgi:signal transduction histidine kinase
VDLAANADTTYTQWVKGSGQAQPPLRPTPGSTGGGGSWALEGGLEQLSEAAARQLVVIVADALGASVADLEGPLQSRLAAAVRSQLIELERRAVRAERLAATGELAANVAHELRNPLSVIETSAFIVAERARSDERIARHARRIADQVAIAGQIVSELLEAARGRPLTAGRVDLTEVARAAVAQVPCPAGKSVTLELPRELPAVWADGPRIRQVLTNLIRNAIEALQGPGRVALTAHQTDRDVLVAVSDDGPGIEPEHLPRLFEPLFTTKPDGTGLGLSLSRKVVRALGGDLTARNRPEGGACFELRLARAPSGPEAT